MRHKYDQSMKKLFVLVASIFLLQACDDGDIALESFNFDNVLVQNCASNNLVFKIKSQIVFSLQKQLIKEQQILYMWNFIFLLILIYGFL